MREHSRQHEITSRSAWLAGLEKSGLLDERAMNAARSWKNRVPDARTLAETLVQQQFITAWQARQLLKGRTAFFLGKYLLLEQLGDGGMGTVFKAKQSHMQRVVALKVLKPELTAQDEMVERFRREIRVAATLLHPNIVTAYDADQVESTYFLVMEFIAGQGLDQMLRHVGPLSVELACDCIRQAALGLQYAHGKGLIHRDIKPGNLLVTTGAEGETMVKILDLGLSQLAHDQRNLNRLTKMGMVMGTPDYMSPEQAKGTRVLDGRADIFALGCTFFEILTGRLPWKGATAMASMVVRQTTDAPSVTAYRDGIPEAIAWVVAKMLDRNLDLRFQTAGAVAEAIARALAGEELNHIATAIEANHPKVDPIPPEPDSLTQTAEALPSELPDQSWDSSDNVLPPVLANSSDSGSSDTTDTSLDIFTSDSPKSKRWDRAVSFLQLFVLISLSFALLVAIVVLIVILARGV